MDVWGSFYIPTHDGKRYFLTLVGDHTRYTWVHLLACKFECFNIFVKFYVMVEIQYQVFIKTIRSDNVRNFFSSSMTTFLDPKGMIHYSSYAHMPQQNMVVERKHQHILNVIRAIQMQASLHIKHWGYSIIHIYIINKLPSKVNDLKSSFELLHNKVPKYDKLVAFAAFAMPQPQLGIIILPRIKK